MLSIALTTTGLDSKFDTLLIVGAFDPAKEETFEFFPRFDPELTDYITNSMTLVELDAKFRGKDYPVYPYTIEEIIERHGADHELQDKLDAAGAVLLHGPWASDFLTERNFQLPERVKFLRDALESVHPDLVYTRWDELAEICNIPLAGRNLGFPTERAKLQWQIYQTIQNYREKSKTLESSILPTANLSSENTDQTVS